jgi:hypothetical protein
MRQGESNSQPTAPESTTTHFSNRFTKPVFLLGKSAVSQKAYRFKLAISFAVTYLIDVAREAARKNEDLRAILNHGKGESRFVTTRRTRLGQEAHFFV